MRLALKMMDPANYIFGPVTDARYTRQASPAIAQ